MKFSNWFNGFLVIGSLVGMLILSQPPYIQTKPVPVKIDSLNQVYCLATNLYFEARSQSEEEQYAVAKVVLNRVEDAKYPNTICGVVYQARLDDNGNPLKHKCQFSWYCDGKKDVIKNKKAYDKAFTVAMKAVINDDDPTEGSLWYHANYVKPSWAKTFSKKAVLGSHVFYARN